MGALAARGAKPRAPRCSIHTRSAMKGWSLCRSSSFMVSAPGASQSMSARDHCRAWIGGHPGPRHKPRRGRHVDDTTGTGRADGRHEVVTAVDHAPEVHIQGLAPVRERCFADGATSGTDARVVDEQVGGLSEPLPSRFLDCGHVLLVRDVALHGYRVGTRARDLRGGLLGGLRMEVHAHHASTPARQLQRERPSNAAPCPRDDRSGFLRATLRHYARLASPVPTGMIGSGRGHGWPAII